MTPESWQQARLLLDALLELPRSERAAYLAAHCPDDELRAELEALLVRTSAPLPASPANGATGHGTLVALPEGTSISHHRIIRRLGAGGMGTVYLAYDSQLHRRVAIKVLRRHDDPAARRRLLREARAAAALDHPAICAVYDVGTDPDAGDFIVMQYVDGETLAEVLARGPTGPLDALSVCRQLAEALVVAHAHGIIHRDLKPRNVIIDTSRRPRLLDFGIARVIATGRDEDAARMTTQLTEVHAVAGTPPYMAPEQILGAPPDVRSDLFSLGCVLYECLTGVRAFDGKTLVEIYGRVLQGDPPVPSTITADLSVGVDTVCVRLLRKDPAARYQSAVEVVSALRELEGVTTTGSTSGVDDAWRGRTRRWAGWLGAAALCSVLVAGVATVVFPGMLARWMTGFGPRLPEAPPEARRWYEAGVEALRNGTYASARASLEEAVRLYPAYAYAHARLAEAYGELDNQLAAGNALIQVSAIVPDQSALGEDERLRLVAVRASVLRNHHEAEAAYRQLADRHPGDAGASVDLARAQDAAGRWPAARETLGRALSIDAQNATAHLRLGLLEARLGQKARALAALDESARLYRAAANVEGEAEALLRRGMVLSAVGDLADAQLALDRVVAMTTDPRYVVQRMRARFELAAVAGSRGRFAEAEKMALDTVDAATRLQLETVAANGLIDLADTLLVAGRHEDADTQLRRAYELAEGRGARQTAMRARLQQASLRQAGGEAKEAIAMAEAPRTFFAANGYVRWEALSKVILSRAYEELENYATASALAAEVLEFADAVADDALASTALENLAGQLTAQGRLPQALVHRERVERIHRKQDDQFSLPFDLVNHADLLVRLGRGAEAETLLGEIDAGIAAGHESYVSSRRRVALLRALRAATEGRIADVGPYATAAQDSSTRSSDNTTLLGTALAEYARAMQGRRLTESTEVQRWGEALASPAQREARYWVARTLVARGERTMACNVVDAALGTARVRDNAELRWRFAATRLLAGGGGAMPPADASVLAGAVRDVAALVTAWRGATAAYFARADLAPLHALVKVK